MRHITNFFSSDFIKIKNKWNGNYFQQLLFHTFPPPMNFICLVFVLMKRILDLLDFHCDVVIGFLKFSFSSVHEGSSTIGNDFDKNDNLDGDAC